MVYGIAIDDRATQLPDYIQRGSLTAAGSSCNADNHSIILFTVRDEASALAKAINVIGNHKFNMRTLRSRSMKNLLWKYYFYVELEGNVKSEDGKLMLKELSEFCDKLKVAGSFYNHIDLK